MKDINMDLDKQVINHPVNVSYLYNNCKCGKFATHKVTEEYPEPAKTIDRHPFTTWMCCECFGDLMGPVALRFCGIK
jgi:hypothetical protein